MPLVNLPHVDRAGTPARLAGGSDGVSQDRSWSVISLGKAEAVMTQNSRIVRDEPFRTVYPSPVCSALLAHALSRKFTAATCSSLMTTAVHGAQIPEMSAGILAASRTSGITVLPWSPH
jgi:hypothetical protein